MARTGQALLISLSSLAAGAALSAPATNTAETANTHATLPIHGGTAEAYTPLLRYQPGGLTLEAPLMARTVYESVGGVRADLDGHEMAPDPALFTTLRVGARFNSNRTWSPFFVAAEYEHDLVTGVQSGGYDDTLEAEGAPLSQGTEGQLRKAYARISFAQFLTIGGGYMTSQWGLGLIANDGAQEWTPGSAAFTSPEGGDRVMRGFVSTGPWTDARLYFQMNYDVVEDDDVTLEGDDAEQMSAALIVGLKRDRTAGLYVAKRHQESADGKETDVTAIDLYGKWTKSCGDHTLVAEFEGAYITGETDLGPTPEYVKHDVQQLGLAARINLGGTMFGGALDALYTSGDQNYDDDAQNGFKTDPNYQMGMFLFRHALASTSARSPITAADPELIGHPSEDLERLPTRGATTNTLAFFPRAWYRPIAGLEIYGGPLFAFADVDNADPRESRLAGGDPRNAFAGTPGGYLGTELDLGVRYRFLSFGTEFTVGVEGGTFLPGSAFDDAAGESLEAVSGFRGLLSYKL